MEKETGTMKGNKPLQGHKASRGSIPLLALVAAGMLSLSPSSFGLGLNSAEAAVKNPPIPASKTFLVKKLVVLPFENFTEDPKAVSFVKSAIKDEIRKKGLLLISSDEAVDEFLAKRRTRYTNSVTRITAREMGMVLDVDAIMVGSIDTFSDENGEVRAGMTARLVSTIDGSIIWADNLSYTGRDFEGLLGLGVVKSVDKLASMIVKDMVRSIPDNFFLRDSSLSPFEAANLSTTPARARSGEYVRVRVRVLPIIDEPAEIKAILGDKEVKLEKIEGTQFYEGMVNAPLGEGAYPVDLVALDSSNKPFSFKAVGEVRVDNTPPKVAMKLSKTIFAPKRKGYVILTPLLKNIEEIEEWDIEILNSEGKVIRNDKGFGKLPKELVWKGESNNLRTVDDGEYTYKFTVRDIAGNATIITDKIKIKSTAPEIQVDVEMTDNKLQFFFDVPSKDEAIESWKLSILDNGKVINIVNGKGMIPPQLEYPVDNGVDLNKVTVSVTATDSAGNPFEFTKSVPSILLKKAPFAKLNEKNRVIEDF